MPEPRDPSLDAVDLSVLPAADAPHYLYGLARLGLLKKGLFPVHAACVGHDGRYALLVGHSGDGKTTVAMSLVGRGGWKMFSGNKTVVDLSAPGQIVAVGGTKTVTTRQADGGRSVARLDLDRSETAPQVPVVAIFRVRLSDGADRAVRLSALSALHTLYPFFLDVANADVILDGGARVLSGEPPVGTREKLARELAAALAKVPAYEVTGSAAFVADKITELT